MDFSKLKFKNGSSHPLYSQLLEALESAIERGELTIGTRLPSERALADQLNLSRATVINAYRELEARGLVHSHVGRGTFVCAWPEGSGPAALLYLCGFLPPVRKEFPQKLLCVGSLFRFFAAFVVGRGKYSLGRQVGYTNPLERILAQFFERRQTEPISTSLYAASTAPHTCRIMAPGLVISDVSNCLFLILFANSIPLNVTSAFPNVLKPSIG